MRRWIATRAAGGSRQPAWRPQAAPWRRVDPPASKFEFSLQHALGPGVAGPVPERRRRSRRPRPTAGARCGCDCRRADVEIVDHPRYTALDPRPALLRRRRASRTCSSSPSPIRSRCCDAAASCTASLRMHGIQRREALRARARRSARAPAATAPSSRRASCAAAITTSTAGAWRCAMKCASTCSVRLRDAAASPRMSRMLRHLLVLALALACSALRDAVRRPDARMPQAIAIDARAHRRRLRPARRLRHRRRRCATWATRALAASTPDAPRHYALLLDRGPDALLARINLIRGARHTRSTCRPTSSTRTTPATWCSTNCSRPRAAA